MLPLPEDMELGELENDAFLPSRDGIKSNGKPDSIFIRWLPGPLRTFVKNLSRMKVSKPLMENGYSLICHVI
jgi:hypothetical protein